MQSLLRSRLTATRQGSVVAAYAVLALVMGGGGSPTAAAELLVQLGFALALAAWVAWAKMPLHSPWVPRNLVALALVVLLLPLVQLIPLPPPLWQALPQRWLEMRALDLIGAGDSWRSLSLAPSRTLASLLALIPAVGLMLAVATIGYRDRRALLLLVGLVGIAGAALGALQMAEASDALRLYQQSHREWVTGFFANRNAAADGFLISSLALAAWFATRPEGAAPQRAAQILYAAGQGLLLVALVLTGSRAGIALVVVALAFHALMFGGVSRRMARRLAWAALVLFALLALVPLVIEFVPRFAAVAARFALTNDFRFELWTDTLFAIGQYWPAGSGLGSFVTVYLPAERLEIVDATYPNRAHNDYLEFLLEGGALAILVLLAAAVLLVVQMRRNWLRREVPPAFFHFALGTLTITALHSIVDYPLRTMALASLSAMAAGICMPRQGSARWAPSQAELTE